MKRKRPRTLTAQMVVRLEPDLDAWLIGLAEEQGRTYGQTVRWILRRYMTGEIHE